MGGVSMDRGSISSRNKFLFLIMAFSGRACRQNIAGQLLEAHTKNEKDRTCLAPSSHRGAVASLGPASMAFFSHARRFAVLPWQGFQYGLVSWNAWRPCYFAAPSCGLEPKKRKKKKRKKKERKE